MPQIHINGSRMPDRLNDAQEVQEILGHPPGWMLRWGIMLIGTVIALGLWLTWLIRYPDTIDASIQLSTENPSIEVVSRQAGPVETLFVSDQQAVQAGEIIVLIRSTASFEDVQTIRAFLQTVRSKPMAEWLTHNAPNDLVLGASQSAFAQWMTALQSYRLRSAQSSVVQKIGSIQREIAQIERLTDSQEKQLAIYDEELQISRRDFDRQVGLHKEGVTSEMDLEKAEMTWLQQKRQHEQLTTATINNHIRIEQLRAQRIDLSSARSEDLADLQVVLRQRTDQLLEALGEWEEKHVLKSPINGRVNYEQIWSTDQFVASGAVICTVVPQTSSNRIMARCALPVHGSGKVNLGQSAHIRLDGFPHHEYGSILSKVASMSLVPASDGEGGYFYQVSLALQDSLVTTSDQHIPFRAGMTGRARIITEDRRVLERIFEGILTAFRDS